MSDDQRSLKDRMEWDFEYNDITYMLISFICTTIGIRKPSDKEGSWLSGSDNCQCFCMKCAQDCAIDIKNLHYTCCRANVSYACIDVKYDKGKRGESPGQCTDTCLCFEGSSAIQACFCINCSAGAACGKIDGFIERTCHILCCSQVCMIPPGSKPHNNPITCGLCTKYFVGDPGKLINMPTHEPSPFTDPAVHLPLFRSATAAPDGSAAAHGRSPSYMEAACSAAAGTGGLAVPAAVRVYSTASEVSDSEAMAAERIVSVAGGHFEIPAIPVISESDDGDGDGDGDGGSGHAAIGSDHPPVDGAPASPPRRTAAAGARPSLDLSARPRLSELIFEADVVAGALREAGSTRRSSALVNVARASATGSSTAGGPAFGGDVVGGGNSDDARLGSEDAHGKRQRHKMSLSSVLSGHVSGGMMWTTTKGDWLETGAYSDAADRYYPPREHMTRDEVEDVACHTAALFGPRNFGSFFFPQNKRTRWFVRIRPEDVPMWTAAERMVEFVHTCLGYPLPRLLISMVGGAVSFEHRIETHVIRALQKGLASAARVANGWVLTGGADVGIMKIVGDAMADVETSNDKDRVRGTGAARGVPVIGISSFGVMNMRRKVDGDLHEGKGRVEYRPMDKVPDARNANLDPNHHMHFLYDDGTENQYGREVGIRTAFEAQVRRTRYHDTRVRVGVSLDNESGVAEEPHRVIHEDDVDIFSVVVLVEGGPVSFKLVEEAINKRTPVLLIEGTGRAADVLSYAWRMLHCTTPAGRAHTNSKLRAYLRQMGIPQKDKPMKGKDGRVLKPEEEIDVWMSRALNIVLDSNLVSVFNPGRAAAESEPTTLHDALMQAVSSAQHPPVVNVASARPDEIDMLKEGVAPRVVGQYRWAHTMLYLSMLFGKADGANKYLEQMSFINRAHFGRTKTAIENYKGRLSETNADGERALSVKRLGTTLVRPKLSKSEEKYRRDVNDVMLWALLRQKLQFVILCAPYVSWHSFLFETIHGIEQFRLNLLFTPLYNGDSRPFLEALYGSVVKKARFVPDVKDLKSHVLAALRSKGMASAAPGGDAIFCFADVQLCVVPFNVDVLLNELIAKVLGRYGEAPKLRVFCDGNAGDAQVLLCIWASVCLHEDIARFFWRHATHASTSTALICSVILKNIAQLPAMARHGHFKNDRDAMVRFSTELEAEAVSLFDRAYKVDASASAAVLKHPLQHFPGLANSTPWKNLSRLATTGECLDFVAAAGFQFSLERDWGAHVGSDTALWRLALCALFPPLLFVPGSISWASRGHDQGLYLTGGAAAHSAENIRKSVSTLCGEIRRRSADDESSHEHSAELGTIERFLDSERAKHPIATMANFYTSPVVKFLVDLVAYIGLVCFFSVVVLDDFSDDALLQREYVLILWFCLLAVHEMYEAHTLGWSRWRRDSWNQIDGLTTVFFFAAAGFRVRATQSGNDAADSIRTAKLLYAVTALLLFARLFRFALFHPELGSLVVFVGHVLRNDVWHWALLFMGVLAGFSLAIALLQAPFSARLTGYPYSASGSYAKFSYEIGQLFFRPAFSLYGELFLDDLSEATATCTGPAPFQGCAWQPSLLPLILWIYFFLAQVVLLNLLIAVLSSTYTLTVEHVERTWASERQKLLDEYEGKSAWPVIGGVVEVVTEAVKCAKAHRQVDHEMAVTPEHRARGAPLADGRKDSVVEHARRVVAFERAVHETHVAGLAPLVPDADDDPRGTHVKIALQVQDLRTRRLTEAMASVQAQLASIKEDVSSATEQLSARERDPSTPIFSRVGTLRFGGETHQERQSGDGMASPPIGFTTDAQLRPIEYGTPADRLRVDAVSVPRSVDEFSEGITVDSPMVGPLVVKYARLRRPRGAAAAAAAAPASADASAAAAAAAAAPGTTAGPGLSGPGVAGSPPAGAGSAGDVSEYIAAFESELIALYNRSTSSLQHVHDLTAELQAHFKANFPDGSPVTRSAVRSDARLWEVSDPDYLPPWFTAPSVLLAAALGVPGVHPEDVRGVAVAPSTATIGGGMPMDSEPLTLARVRADNDRCCHADAFGRIREAPLNPGGRTGLAGRGVLSKWGPNRGMIQMITRFSSIERGGRRVMEVLVELAPKGNASWQLPNTLECSSGIVPQVRTKFGLPVAGAGGGGGAGLIDQIAVSNDFSTGDSELVEATLSGGELVWGFDTPEVGDPLPGHVSDDRDTDNAWVEVNVFHTHIPAHLEEKFVLVDGSSDAVPMTWAVVHSNMRLPRTHLRFCQRMAEETDVFWGGS